MFTRPCFRKENSSGWRIIQTRIATHCAAIPVICDNQFRSPYGRRAHRVLMTPHKVKEKLGGERILKTLSKCSHTAIITGIQNVRELDSASLFVIAASRVAVLHAKLDFPWTNAWCRTQKSFVQATLASMVYVWLAVAMRSAVCSRADAVPGDQVEQEPWQYFCVTIRTLVLTIACL